MEEEADAGWSLAGVDRSRASPEAVVQECHRGCSDDCVTSGPLVKGCICCYQLVQFLRGSGLETNRTCNGNLVNTTITELPMDSSLGTCSTARSAHAWKWRLGSVRGCVERVWTVGTCAAVADAAELARIAPAAASAKTAGMKISFPRRMIPPGVYRGQPLVPWPCRPRTTHPKSCGVIAKVRLFHALG